MPRHAQARPHLHTLSHTAATALPQTQLAAFVHTLLGQDDVRSVVRERFHLHGLVASSQLPPGYG